MNNLAEKPQNSNSFQNYLGFSIEKFILVKELPNVETHNQKFELYFQILFGLLLVLVSIFKSNQF